MKRSNLKSLTCVLVAFLLSGCTVQLINTRGKTTQSAAVSYSSSWNLVGAPGFATNSGLTYVLGVDRAGKLYYFFSDNAVGSDLSVYTFDGTNWTIVGLPGLTAISEGGLGYSMAFDSTNTPYIAYSDSSNGNTAVVRKWNGTAWALVGTAGFSVGSVAEIRLVIDSTDAPVVAYTDVANANKGTVMRFNGTNWSALGGAGFTVDVVSNLSLLPGAAGVLYFGFQDGSQSGKGSLYSWNGTAWSALGGAGFTSTAIVDTALARTTNGNIYFGYRAGPLPYSGYVATWDGASWTTLATPFDTSGTSDVHLAVDADENINVAFYSSGLPYGAVKKWNGTGWSTVGASLSHESFFGLTFTADPSGTLYVAGVNYQGGQRINVRSYRSDKGASNLGWTESNPSPSTTLNASWTPSKGASNQEIQYYSDELCRTAVGSPINLLSATKTTDATTGTTSRFSSYRLITTVSDSTEKRWSQCSAPIAVGPAWVDLNSSVITATGANAGMAVSPAGVVYIAASDPAAGNKLTIRKYSSGTWSTVGTAGISDGNPGLISIDVGALERPIVAYTDATNTSKVSVQQWNGTAWNFLGAAAGLTANNVLAISLKVDSNDIPYLAYTDPAATNKGTVLQWNGAAWTALGGAGYTVGSAASPVLAMDSTDRPYILYVDGANASKATVQRWNGAAWVTIGLDGFTAGFLSHGSLALSSTNVPYIAYKDNMNANKLTVMTYNGAAWVTVGAAGISSNTAQWASIVIDSTGAPCVAFQDWGNGIKQSVIRWNGSAWGNLGAAGFSLGAPQFVTLAKDATDHLYLSYQDPNIPSPVIRKFAP